jgi:cytochrome oxidase assembly protein ShyY1
MYVLYHLHPTTEGHAGEAGTRLSKGIPVGRAPTIDLRNAHLSYVITWSAGSISSLPNLLILF